MTTLSKPPRRPGLTRADLESAPDDGYRYEIVDGELFVTPAPGYRHQRITLVLGSLLDRSCPSHLVTPAAPFAVGLAEDTEVQPTSSSRLATRSPPRTSPAHLCSPSRCSRRAPGVPIWF